MSRVRSRQRATSNQPQATGRTQPRPKRHSRTGSFFAGDKRIAALAALLAGVTIAFYSPVFGNLFVILDDRDYVTANPHIHEGLSWSMVKWAFTSTEAANWHPLTWLSHAFDYQLFALNPAGHHLDSVLLHALNAALLFALLAWVTKRTGPSLLVAALFALHPLNVESVAWLAERKNVLSMLFFLLAIGAYVRYAQKPDWRRYLLVAGLFAAGLTAKPMVITLPFVLLLLDYWPLERTAGSPPSSSGVPQLAFSRLVLEKVPLLLLSAASAWITLKAQRHVIRTFEQFSLAVRIKNAEVAYASYLGKMVWPDRLAALYPHPGNTLPVWQVILSALVLSGVTVLVLVYRRRRYLPVGWFWFLGTLVPVIGLVQVGGAAMADRYTYLPLIGIFVMIAWGLADWAETKKLGMAWRIVPAVCVLAALGLVTIRQIGYWDSEYAVWARALAVTDPERSAFANYSLARTLMDPGVEMTPEELARFESEQQREDEAREHYEESSKIIQRHVAQQNSSELFILNFALNSLGMLDEKQNRIDDARRHFEEALSTYRRLAQQYPGEDRPAAIRTLNDLAMLEARQNRLDDARRHFEEALEDSRQLAQQDPGGYLPGVAGTLNNLALLDMNQNRKDDARRHYEEALTDYRQLAQQDPDKYLPNVAITLHDLGTLDEAQIRLDEARRHFEDSLKIYRQLAQQDPNQYLPYVAGSLNTLGLLDKNQNRMDEARKYYQQALALFQRLAQADSRFSGNVARTAANLEELGRETNPN